jgi:putative acetyltransferase
VADSQNLGPDSQTPGDIEALDPESAAASAILAESDAYMAALYPTESNHMVGAEALAAPGMLLLGCTVEDELAACGAVKIVVDDPDYGEIKRVFVRATHRGRGVSTAIMHALESHLGESGIALARLETGVEQTAAIALYRKLGYVERGPFGGYAEDPLSVFMEKRLAI